MIDGDPRLSIAAITYLALALAARNALVVAFVGGVAIGRLCLAGIVCAIGRATLEVGGVADGIGAELGFAGVNGGDVVLPRAVFAEWGCLRARVAVDVALGFVASTSQGQCVDRSLWRAI